MAQDSAGHLNKIGLPAIQRSSAVQTRDFDAEPQPVTAALRGLFGNLRATATGIQEPTQRSAFYRQPTSQGDGLMFSWD
jgi:hypothetical protein